MADQHWLCSAVAVKDVYTETIGGTWVAAETYTITVGSRSLVVTIGSLVTTAQVATTIKQAFESQSFTDTTASCLPEAGGTSIPEMASITATVSGSVVTFRGDVAGVPHTLSSSEASTSGTVSLVNTIPATGPNDRANAANWSAGALATGDTVTIDRPVSLLYGASQSGVLLASLYISPTFVAANRIGLPVRNAAGYEEYRPTEWEIGVTSLLSRATSNLIKINTGTGACAADIRSTGSASAEDQRSAFQLRGNHASNSLVVYGGLAGYGSNDETSQLATCAIHGGTFVAGRNCTIAAFTKDGGSATLRKNPTTTTNIAGNLLISAG